MPTFLIGPNGELSKQPVYSEDVKAWVAQGWRPPPEPEAKDEKPKAMQLNEPVYLVNESGELSNQKVHPTNISAWLSHGWKLPEAPQKPLQTSAAPPAQLSPRYLYKEGKQSHQPVRPQDFEAWLGQGWTINKETSFAVGVSQPEPIAAIDVATAEDVEIELLALYEAQGWSAIKKEAEKYGIAKHEDGWEETIPEIAQKKIQASL